MANKDWSAGVYWEIKSPEWPPAHSSKPNMSPEQDETSPLSPYSDGNQSGFSPTHRNLSYYNKRARWEWSSDSGNGEGSSSSATWTEYQWSPSSSRSPTSSFSVHDGIVNF